VVRQQGLRGYTSVLCKMHTLQGYLAHKKHPPRQQGLRGYTSVLCKMEPLTASPKNDVIVAWPSQVPL